MNSKKVIGDNYKEVYKKQHQAKNVSTDPEAKSRFNIFKVNPIFKYEDKKHFQDLYNFDINTLDQYKLPEDKKDLRQIISKKKEKKIKTNKKTNFNTETLGESIEDEELTKRNLDTTKNKNDNLKKNLRDRVSEIDQDLEEENMEIIDQLEKDHSEYYQ
jgi:hypothetical protein